MFVYLPDVFDDDGACGYSWCFSGAKKQDKFALCAVALGTCASNPCTNGSTCLDLPEGHTCVCAPGYGGNTCETDIDECTSAPCQNGATCHDELNQYTCQCAAGYTGLQCEIDIDECASNPCWGGGTCIDKVDGYSCVCPEGFAGETCRTVAYADGCLMFSSDAVSYPEASQECQNRGGHLVDVKEAELQRLIADSIPTGSDVSPWIGLKMSPGVMTYADGSGVSDQVEWSAGGPPTSCDVCVYLDSADGYSAKTDSCTEPHHYVCQSDIDECSSSPCQNGGVCLNGVNSYHCYCPFGYTGDSCQTDLDLCAMVSCPSDWQCQDEGSSREYEPYPCSGAPCPDGMNCKKEGSASFSCRVG
uniref:Fibropellin-1-like n=1 Tax=Branchiostoma floridae TaxID=7739 RepID=C3ZK83_BRAFL|eukprot:XP_002590971.1 hypothetical protein BRAFLDRAFT_69478 [Branchiostoma floridae]